MVFSLSLVSSQQLLLHRFWKRHHPSKMIRLFVALLVTLAVCAKAQESQETFRKWVDDEYLVRLGQLMNGQVQASWNYETNITDANQAVMVTAAGNLANYTKTMSGVMKTRFNQALVDTFTDDELKRLYRKTSTVGDAALSSQKYETLTKLISDMSTIYSTAKVCRVVDKPMEVCPPEQQLDLEPGVQQLLDDPNTDENLLAHVWNQWREQTGKKMRQSFIQYVDLKNEAARANGYGNNAQMWRAPYVEPQFNYTDTDFVNEVKSLYQQIKPLYGQLHAYVRGKLIDKRGSERSPANGPIPAHLLGNMWAQSWLGTLNFTQLYPEKPKLDVTDEMKRQNYDAERMFRLSDKFFTDLGQIPMPPTFWNRSMLVRPSGREVTCHASAWDFYDGEDFRVKQCTDITMQDLFTVHHEMGHVEYFLQYKEQRIPFRDGANDGFHEAIGDVMALSVSTPEHLRKLGLLPNASSTRDTESDLNFQMSTALEKIAFLPFGLMLDLYRYDVFSDIIPTTQLNQKWWEYVNEYQGLCAPSSVRSEEYFDPGSKFHVPADVPYMRYFVSFIIQFQFHEALCKEAGHTGALYTCDIDGNKAAGKKLADALKMGSTKPWQEVMQTITGQTKMDAAPLLKFFQPLYDHLIKVNKENNYPIGWTKDAYCPNKNDNFKDYIYNGYNQKAQEIIFRATEAAWAYNTNITDHNSEVMNALEKENAEFDKREAAVLKSNFSDIATTGTATSQRLYTKLTKLGAAALDDAKFKELQDILVNMSTIYNTAKVCRDTSIPVDQIDRCPAEKRMSLEPEITVELANNRDPEFLKYLWKSWRDATGKKMREYYKKYIALKNEAAKADGYADNGDAWRAPYVEPTESYTSAMFLTDVDRVWKQMEPLYKELHAFVRHRLRSKYPDAKIDPKGPIPAHLLGNMWAQTWGSVQNFTQLYPEKPPLDVTPQMKAQGYNATRMFRDSNKFFSDLGLKPMPQLFWDKSMIEKPTDRNVVCHASAWDFYNQQDFRIKQCTDVTMDDFITVHHEMGHVEYYLQYKDLPVPFRRGANDGFHEAVGDVLALSVSTPKHLKKIGLLDSSVNINDDKLDLNFMYSTALDKIAFLPFGLMMDMYRYDVFRGVITPENLNSKWWEYRLKYQGVCSPVARSENDFDPGAKYHIPADVPYMRYFVSFVIQFQFHKALCNASGHTGPLYQCDIDGSKEAGKLLGQALSMGSSRPWQEVMFLLTGSRNMDAQPLLDFFQPLTAYLATENAKTGVERAGWTSDVECKSYSGAPSVMPSLLLICIAALFLLFKNGGRA